jgi:hypothetical protein
VTDAPGKPRRDPYIDFIRAFSLIVVVIWHWCFTIVIWRDDGPHASNPIRFTSGLWMLTWLFQVMPLFFFVGGFANLMSWTAREGQGGRMGHFVLSRVKQLLIPALGLAVTWIAFGLVLNDQLDGPGWVGRSVKLVISPLWFIGAYLIIICLFPVFEWLHDRFDVVVVVVLIGAAWLVDVLRFRFGNDTIGMANMILVWGMCHQLGFFYRRIVDAHRRVAWALTLGGLLALTALVASDQYPGSMVGVPGEPLSNMAPPTMCIVALLFFQAGIAVLIRGPIMERLRTSERWAAFSSTLNRFSMPLFLFHSTGMAVAWFIGRTYFGAYRKTRPDLSWWLWRPFSFIGPLLCTLPVIFLFGKRWIKPAPTVPAEELAETRP